MPMREMYDLAMLIAWSNVLKTHQVTGNLIVIEVSDRVYDVTFPA